MTCKMNLFHFGGLESEVIQPFFKSDYFLGLGRATIFMARVGFRASVFGPGRARATVKLPRVGFGLKRLKKLKFGPTFGPNSGHFRARLSYFSKQ